MGVFLLSFFAIAWCGFHTTTKMGWDGQAGGTTLFFHRHGLGESVSGMGVFFFPFHIYRPAASMSLCCFCLFVVFFKQHQISESAFDYFFFAIECCFFLYFLLCCVFFVFLCLYFLQHVLKGLVECEPVQSLEETRKKI
ncbi:hypothetical protein QBC35DRAFT_81228 [Podospora australis]|uniref:Uncharacterized protein n=1 Tax=Podospora australis TaxID=1536484 RepID=A0AAN7AIZ1_9PEZI|nr:hypothetical protein QBC35DRAFT_81228 [Podospora australis]